MNDVLRSKGKVSAEEDARAQAFRQTVQDIKTRNADTEPDALQNQIDIALQSVRKPR